MQQSYNSNFPFSSHRIFVGVGLAFVGALLFTGGLFGWIVDPPSEPVRVTGMTVLLMAGLVFIVGGTFIALLKRTVTIDTDLGTISRMVSAGMRLFCCTEQLSEFGAITLHSSGRGNAIGHDRFAETAYHLRVCLVRGSRDEAAKIACSWPGDALHQLRAKSSFGSQVNIEDVRRYHNSFLIVTTAVNDVEVSRSRATELAKLTGLPFGHPTLGPDAPDESMQPLELAPELCLDRTRYGSDDV